MQLTATQPNLGEVILDALAPALRQELGKDPEQLDLFPQLLPLPNHERVVLRALIETVNAPASAGEPKLNATALLAALSQPRHPDPGNRIFRAPGRLRRLLSLVDRLAATRVMDEASRERVENRLEKFILQGESAALMFRRDPACRPWGVTQNEVAEAKMAPPAITMSNRDPRLAPLRAALFAAMLMPPVCYAEGDRSVTEVLGVLRYVIDHGQRRAFNEVRSPGGRWQFIDSQWELDSPLLTWHWVELLMKNHPELLRDVIGEPASDDEFMVLRSRLCYEVIASRLLPHLRGNIVQAVALHRDVKRLAEAIVHPADLLRPTSWDYTQAWRESHEWSRLLAENRGLAVMLRTIQRHDPDPPATRDGFAGLKWRCLGLGVGRSGWQLLCRHATAIVGRALDGCEHRRVDKLIALQARLLRGFRDRLPRPELIDAVLGSVHLVRHFDDLVIPHRLIELADAATRDAARLDEFIAEEWLPVIAWLVEAKPVFHRNQWARGWPCILAAKQAWALRKLAEASTPEWNARREALEFPGHEAVELDSAARLAVEGVEMAHCVMDFAGDCTQGRYRVFSVRRRDDGKRVATIGCDLGDRGWSVDQVTGRANAKVSDEIQAIARKVVRACNVERETNLRAAA